MQTIYFINSLSFTHHFSATELTIKTPIEIFPHEVVLLSGASGIGKSTFLYILKGLIPHVISGKLSGGILFKGRELIDLTAVELNKIALLQQNPDAQVINRYVLNELAFGLENLEHNPTKIIEEIKQYVKQFDLEYLLHREFSSLSGGEKQRIQLLSLLLTNPEVLLLDEPTAFLDPKTALLFIDFLSNLRHKITIIIIEHNLHYLEPLCPFTKHIVIDRSGNVIQEDITNINKKLIATQSTAVNNINGFNGTAINSRKILLKVIDLNYNYNSLHTNKNKNIIAKDNTEVGGNLLENINFQLAYGEILGICGASGCGKSTLLKIIARLIKTSNSVYLEDKEVSHIHYKEYYSQVGLLFQNPENHFIYNSVIQELNNDVELLQALGLNTVAEQNPFTLSEGQKRRLSFATLCILGIKKIMLLDEPSFGQDEINKNILLQMIKNKREHGVSFIIVSHDNIFLQQVCDRILVLDNK